jgi:RNA polymerase sigma-70 factor, ECF subfamily
VVVQAGHEVGDSPGQPGTEANTLERLFGAHHRDVFRYALRRTGNEAAAEDVVAETFSIVWRRANDVPAEPLPWLYGIARRVISNQDRSRRRRERLGAALRLQAGRDAAHAASPEGALMEADALTRALSQLSGGDREILMLTAWEGLGSEDGAAVLGITANTFRVRLSRARQRLQAELDRDGGDTP